MQILVVEDDRDTQANLRDILELDEHQVEVAATVAQTLARQDWTGLGVILLDRQLPDGTAEDLLPRLKQLAPEATVMIVTAYDDLQGAVSALRQGASDYILKPVNADVLRASLARIAELRQMRDRLRQAERLAAIGETIAGLAHESRNALQRSQSCLEMLALEVQDRPAALDWVRRLQQAQDRLHRLYEEVRGYAAPIQLKRGRHDLGEILRDVWADVLSLRLGKRVHVREKPPSVALDCEVDRFQIEQLFRNILENALDACAEPAEIQLSWSAATLAGRPAVQLAVRDNGPGLTPEAQRRIFEPFYTTKTRGTGLGMAIAQRIVEAHGGRIAVGQHSGPGAEILVALPQGNL